MFTQASHNPEGHASVDWYNNVHVSTSLCVNAVCVCAGGEKERFVPVTSLHYSPYTPHTHDSQNDQQPLDLLSLLGLDRLFTGNEVKFRS